MACFLIAYSLCGTLSAHTNCRLQSATLRVEDCKCIHTLASPIIARSCNIRANCDTRKTTLSYLPFPVNNTRMLGFRLTILALGALLAHHAHAESPRYQGTGSCSSSNCHGSVNPIKGSKVLQNEYFTWLKHDSHSKAYTVLTKPDAQKIAKHLNLGDPTKEKICLECHATYVPDKAQRGDKYTIEDGVSCESCHGAAEGWLASHSAADATHTQNIQNGLADTVSLEKRATLCLSCHYGDETKRVTHELYGAGHPRLRFELDTYGILQPKHWVVDDDYRTRKEDYSPIRAWFMGQAKQAESLVKMLQNPHTAKAGLFPELSLFDCYSCHHNLSQEQWKDRNYAGQPGRLHVHLTPLILLQAALRDLYPALSKQLSESIATISSDYQKDGTPEALRSLAGAISSELLPAVRSLPTDTATCTKALHSLAQFGLEYASPKFELAEQVGMGLQAVLATSPELATRYNTQLKAVFDTIGNPDTFRPQKFASAVKRLS